MATHTYSDREVGDTTVENVTINGDTVGLASSAKQDTGNATLTTISGKFSVGDQLKASSTSITPATDIPRSRFIGSIQDVLIDIGGPIRITNNAASQSVAVPGAAKAFACQAELGEVRLEIGGAATLRVPEDAWLIYPIVGGTQSLYSYGIVGTFSNVRFLG
jgi:hypothetical protein